MAEEKMPEKKNGESGTVLRREFLKDGGLIVAGALIGTTSILARSADAAANTVTTQVEVPLDVPESGVLVHDPTVCAGCGVCEVMCSLYHEGASGRALSRLHVVRDPLAPEASLVACQQCASPGCYLACPLRDKAACIDAKTGARYINEEKCISCRLCIEACPFDPPRVTSDAEGERRLKCDLCKDRAEGPICVEYCPMKALTLVPKEGR